MKTMRLRRLLFTLVLLLTVLDSISSNIGVELFEEEIDDVIFQTNEFLTDATFTGDNGPFWWILQMSMCLGALFAIIIQFAAIHLADPEFLPNLLALLGRGDIQDGRGRHADVSVGRAPIRN